jgi:hypothetical protein
MITLISLTAKGCLVGIYAEDLAMSRKDEIKIIILLLNPKLSF